MSHDPRRGNLGGNVGGTIRCDASRVEMAAFDSLGPKTQHVLRYALLSVSAVGVVNYAKMWGVNDAKLASDVKRRIEGKTGIPFDAALCERRGNDKPSTNTRAWHPA